MPKGFTEKERDLIRKRIFREGNRLFDRFGIQKTTVDEIAKASGISKGSFYSFYGSKEELFFDILESLDRENKKKLSGDLFPKDRSYRESFRTFLNGIFDSFQNAPILKKMNPADLELLLRKLPGDKVTGHLSNDSKYFEEFYKIWHSKGVFKELDPKAFTGMVKTLFYFNLHQADFNKKEFKAAKELMINMFCEYMIKE